PAESAEVGRGRAGPPPVPGHPPEGPARRLEDLQRPQPARRQPPGPGPVRRGRAADPRRLRGTEGPRGPDPPTRQAAPPRGRGAGRAALRGRGQGGQGGGGAAQAGAARRRTQALTPSPRRLEVETEPPPTTFLARVSWNRESVLQASQPPNGGCRNRRR